MVHGARHRKKLAGPIILRRWGISLAYSAAIAGASGYAGGEILRLLANHPEVDVTTVTAHSQVGANVGSVHPHLRSMASMTFEATTPEVLAGHDIVFFALPHGASGELSAALEQVDLAGPNIQTLLIDCGADRRLHSREAWDSFYDGEFHEPWTYGLPELPVASGKQRNLLRGTRRIAAPGCNASAVELSLAPGVHSGLIDASDIVATLTVGPSGAGRTLKPHLLASELLGNARPYSVAGTHRHIPEIIQGLNWAAVSGAPESRAAVDSGIRISFTPVLVPLARGILASVTAPVNDGVTEDDLRAAWDSIYGDETFVEVLAQGAMPQISDTLGANTALMGLALDKAAGRVLIVTAIDNLTKGTAGAAIQSMNIALGLPEFVGLSVNGVAP